MPSAAQIRYLQALADALSPYLGGGGGGITAEDARDTIGAALVAGSGVAISVNDGADTITISALPEYIRDTIGTALVAGTNVTITVDDPGDTITIDASGGGGGSVGVAQGTVDFGSQSDYAEVVIAATWVTSSHRVIPTVRGGTGDHPLADEDAAIEELHPVVVAITAATSVTIGVHAPNTTTGQYLVDIIGAA